MRVEVEYIGHMKNIVGGKRLDEVELENGASVATLLLTLSEKYGEPFKKAIYEKGSIDVKSNFIATVNGFLLNQLKGLATNLKNDDHVILMPVVSGG